MEASRRFVLLAAAVALSCHGTWFASAQQPSTTGTPDCLTIHFSPTGPTTFQGMRPELVGQVKNVGTVLVNDLKVSCKASGTSVVPAGAVTWDQATMIPAQGITFNEPLLAVGFGKTVFTCTATGTNAMTGQTCSVTESGVSIVSCPQNMECEGASSPLTSLSPTVAPTTAPTAGKGASLPSALRSLNAPAQLPTLPSTAPVPSPAAPKGLPGGGPSPAAVPPAKQPVFPPAQPGAPIWSIVKKSATPATSPWTGPVPMPSTVIPPMWHKAPKPAEAPKPGPKAMAPAFVEGWSSPAVAPVELGPAPKAYPPAQPSKLSLRRALPPRPSPYRVPVTKPPPKYRSTSPPTAHAAIPPPVKMLTPPPPAWIRPLPPTTMPPYAKTMPPPAVKMSLRMHLHKPPPPAFVKVVG